MMEFRCNQPGCERADPSSKPFSSKGARGGHLRRRHGLASVAQALRRPPNGTFRCTEPECTALQPYVTSGGLASHLRTAHGFVSTREDSVARRRRRNAKRIEKLQKTLADLQPKRRVKLPASLATTRHDPPHARVALSSTQYEYLRRRALYVLNGTWARELDMPPESLRDAIAAMCATNFAPGGKTTAQSR